MPISLICLKGGERSLTKRRDWTLTEKEKKVYENLKKQAERLLHFKKHHQSKRGTARYRAGIYEFCKHLAIYYKSQNFRNISDKHLESFVIESVKAGISSAAIKTDLAAIRKLHSLVSNSRNMLTSDNSKFNLKKRRTRGVDRAWTSEEIVRAKQLAKEMDRVHIFWAITITEFLGTRIEEVTALRRTQLKKAINTESLRLVNTKGGIPRDIPLNNGARSIFQTILATPSTTDTIFFGWHGWTHDQAMKSIQNWIANHRTSFMENVLTNDNPYQQSFDIDEMRPRITFHGLRHTFARREYEKRIKQGLSFQTARLQTAALLGHGRDEVTTIYLGKKEDQS